MRNILQVRITNSDGSNPIILERTENRSYYKAINLGEEGISFEIAKNAPKADVLNPDTTGYKRFWEVWDTNTNERLNRGPITTITENGPNWKVEGLGRSALLSDFFKTVKTFYYTLDSILDDLRFENITIEPRTTTLVSTNSAGDSAVFGGVTIDERYIGLSKQTKDNAIDDNIGVFKPGQIEPPNTYFTTSSFWAGQSKQDTLVVDLGGTYDLSKIVLTLPWWGGLQKVNNRAYDFALDYALALPSPATLYKGRRFGAWHNLYTTPSNNKLVTPPSTGYRFYIGTRLNGTSIEYGSIYIAQDIPGPLSARFLRVRITDVHAWAGTIFDNVGPVDSWDFQCDPDYNPGDNSRFGNKVGLMADKTVNDRVLEPANDCFASIVEVGAYQEIIPRDQIQPLALQRIDDSNLQITYSHTVQASETTTTPHGYRKFEPGGYFRKYHVTWSGATTSYTKFFPKDCTNCFPDGFNFGIMDQNNSLIYASDSTSATNVSLRAPAYTSTLLMKGATDAVVTSVDTWPSVTDAFSWNTSYSFSEVANDTASVHFRGQSFKWYATVPTDKTGANVRIEIRSKSAPSFSTTWNVNTWSGWSTLVNSMTLDSNISATLVYEITYESGILLPETVYEIKITNLDGNFCSVDSFEGYWSGSLTEFNEDSHRVFLSDVTKFNQIYDKRFSAGSMYKISKAARIAFAFIGDRVVVYSAKGRNFGKMRIGLGRVGSGGNEYDNPGGKVAISGADSNNILTVDLDTGKRGNEIPRYVIFDSNDHIPGGLPWDRYSLSIQLVQEDIEKFNTADTAQFDSFVARCADCKTPTGDTISVTKPVFLDGIACHEALGLSVSFDNETHLDILKSVTEAVQIESDITEDGLLVKPRLGVDTDIILREGQNTVVDYGIVNDVTQIASMLLSNGSDIDGLPLFTVTEDKTTREDLGRTVMRKEDFRDVADYFQLIGLSRTNLRKRKKPEKRITVTTTDNQSLNHGDSFILYTKKMGPLRVRLTRITRLESSSAGATRELECIRWPQII